ncbi:MAG: hypothetical protein JWQ83_2, partial [Lacunisphaera sp.]|nr:hypothetical protein [Lacunisphaera sp.]
NQEAADVAAAALLASGGKVRADKDKVAARIVEAVIIARGGQTDAVLIGLLLPAVLNVNTNNTLPASKQLTAAGKEAVIAKALRATSGLGAAIAAQTITSALSAGGTTPDLKRTAFTVAVLKGLIYKPQVYDPALASTSQATETTKGTLVQLNQGAPELLLGSPFFNNNGVPPSIAGVRDYIDAVLDQYSTTTPQVKTTTALALAEGVATNPAVSGAVFGGLVKDLKASAALADDNAITTLVRTTILRAKLAPDIADIVQNGLSQLITGTPQGSVAALLPGSSAANKGKIASGAIRAAADASAATTIVNVVLSPTTEPAKDVTQAGLSAFAGAAATGNGDPGTAAAINLAVIAKLVAKPTAAADLTAVQAIATAIIKAIAPANPEAAREVARSMFDITRSIGTNPAANPYTTIAARQKLAGDLAKGAATNYTAAGAAVGGVVQRSVELDNSVTPDLDVSIAAAGLKAASKAALSIAQKTSFYLMNNSGFSAQTFAAKLALSVASTSAGDVAAGVALTDTSHAGDIVKAVITSQGVTTVGGVAPTAAQKTALNKAALAIAGRAAVAVDVEAIGDIAQKVGTLFQPSTNPSNANLPKLSTLGSLATSLGKAINTKPQVSNHNRVDELGELAAVLVTASLNVQGGNTAAALAAIGANIYKAASAKLLANVGNNAADLMDIAGDVAGAIAQTIALAPAPVNGVGGLTPTEKKALLELTGTGSLIKLLTTGAKTFANQVNGLGTSAFNLVRATEILGTGVYGVVGGSEAIGSNGVVLFANGKFEIGAIVDQETRIKDL